MRRILVFLERYGLPCLVMLTVVAFVMAVRQATQEVGAGHTALGWGWGVVETVTSDAPWAKGWTKAMHLALGLTLGWAAVRVYAAAAGLQWDSWVARRLMRGHVVIAAGRALSQPGDASPGEREGGALRVDKGAQAVDLALSLVPRHSVVLALPGVDAGTRARLWEAGVRVLGDDLAVPALLQTAGVGRARQLIAMRDAHADNIAIVRAALSPTVGNRALECKCMVEPHDLRRDFDPEDYFDAATLPRIRVFNEAELIARRLVRDQPPDVAVATSDDQRVHVVLVGLGQVGQSVLLQLARLGHYRSRKKPLVTIVDARASERWAEVCKDYQALPDWLVVRPEEKHLEDVDVADATRWLGDEEPVTMVYVCTRDEVINLRVARLFLRAGALMPSKGAAAPDVVAIAPAGGHLLADYEAHGDHGGRFRAFSFLRASEGLPSPLAGSLLSDVDDRIARRIHEGYLADAKDDPGRANAPANRPWEQLAETYRESNRSVADHFEVKLRAVGCRLAPVGTGVPATFTAEQMEWLARMEHDRWWADRALDGWSLGPKRDDARRHHPNMIPYEQLSQDVKDMDHQSIANVRRLFRETGREVVRVTTTA